MVWWWLLLRNRHSWALSSTVSSVASFIKPLSFSLSLGGIIWPSGLMSFCVCFLMMILDLDTNGGVDPLGVFPLFLKMVTDIIAQKLRIIFRGLIRRGKFPV